jgi:hypothetical protein
MLGFLPCLAFHPLMAQDSRQVLSVLERYPYVYINPDGYLNGRRNSYVYPTALGNPYFMLEGESGAMLETVYGEYDSLLMKYDLLNDEVLLGIRDGSGTEEICVNRDIVLGFHLFGHKFLHLAAIPVASPGYYEQVYDGQVKFYIKHIKILSQRSGQIRYEYVYKTQMILVKEEQYYVIRNKPDLLDALGYHRKELRSFMRKNHMLIRTASGEEMVRILKYYESL